MIDFHCHLDLYPNPHRLAASCRDRHLLVLSVTTTPRAWIGTRSLSREGDGIHTALGLHPQLAHERYNEIDIFREHLPKTQYVGEIGLDGSPEHRRSWSLQVELFEQILQACQQAGGRIMSIHSRRAASAALECLSSVPAAGIAIMHWFSGTNKELDRAIQLGCWFSVGPAMLMSERGRAIASRMPREKVLTETDGPFAQMDGVPLQPWDCEKALPALSKIWSLPQKDTQTMLTENARHLMESLS